MSKTPRDVVGEARWPMVSAVLVAIVLTLLLPDDLKLGTSWVMPLLEGVLLVTLDRRRSPARSLAGPGSCA